MSAKIYTRSGDKGSTSLVTGQRVPKDHARIEAYGSVDELNAVLGILRCHLMAATSNDLHSSAEEVLQVQERLFCLGSELACFDGQLPKSLENVVISDEEPRRLEVSIDRMWDRLPPLSNFVLPGGNLCNSYSHLARTVCRRAERQCVALVTKESVRPAIIIYLNRLSDWLFALARFASARLETSEIPWQPRKT